MSVDLLVVILFVSAVTSVMLGGWVMVRLHDRMLRDHDEKVREIYADHDRKMREIYRKYW